MIAIIYIAMGHSRDEKASSHERIVGITAAQIRENGTQQPGVAEIMRAAGLTHGGFYKHFGSRDELIDEAVGRALTDNEPLIEQMTADAADPLGAFADWYVSTAHRDDPAAGCAVVALGADVGRVGGRAQDAYRAQVERYIAPSADAARRRRRRRPSSSDGDAERDRRSGADRPWARGHAAVRRAAARRA